MDLRSAGGAGGARPEGLHVPAPRVHGHDGPGDSHPQQRPGDAQRARRTQGQPGVQPLPAQGDGGHRGAVREAGARHQDQVRRPRLDGVLRLGLRPSVPRGDRRGGGRGTPAPAGGVRGLGLAREAEVPGGADGAGGRRGDRGPGVPVRCELEPGSRGCEPSRHSWPPSCSGARPAIPRMTLPFHLHRRPGSVSTTLPSRRRRCACTRASRGLRQGCA